MVLLDLFVPTAPSFAIDRDRAAVRTSESECRTCSVARISSFRVMSTDSESYETTSSYYGRVDNGGYDANDRRIAQIEKAFGSAGQVTNDLS